MAATLELHLVTPEREVWSGQATFVSARGIEGDVGILPFHAPMLIRLAVSELGVKSDEGDFRAVVDGGFLHISTIDGVSRVDVLAEHAELEDEVDYEKARRDAEEWERRVQEHDTDEAKIGLAKALARVNLKG